MFEFAVVHLLMSMLSEKCTHKTHIIKIPSSYLLCMSPIASNVKLPKNKEFLKFFVEVEECFCFGTFPPSSVSAYSCVESVVNVRRPARNKCAERP